MPVWIARNNPVYHVLVTCRGALQAYDQFYPPRSYDKAMTQAASIHVRLCTQGDPEALWDWRHRNRHYRRH